MAHERHNAAFILGAIAGGLAGAAVTLFKAPQSGEQTRSRLAGQANALTQRASETLARVEGETQRRVGDVTTPFAALKPRDGEVLVPAPGSVSGADTEPISEPVLLLPDPLEPDPIVETVTTIERNDRDSTLE